MPTSNLIAVPNEVDAYVVQLQANTLYVASVTGSALGSSTGNTLPNPFVGIADFAGNVIAVQDDTPEGGVDPRLLFSVTTPGDYLVAVGDLTGGTGSYTIGVYDQFNNLQPGSFVTDVVVDPTMTSGPPPGSFDSQPGNFSVIPPGQPGSVGVTGIPQNVGDGTDFALV